MRKGLVISMRVGRKYVILVLAVLLLAVYGKNPFLLIAGIVLGIGHIGIHWMHRKELVGEKKPAR